MNILLELLLKILMNLSVCYKYCLKRVSGYCISKHRVKRHLEATGKGKPMNIILNQSFEIDNLITQSGQFTIIDFQKALMNISKEYKDYVLNNGEYIITTTRSIEIIDGEQLMDTEILLPANCRIQVEKPYIFKNKIKIANALYSKVEDIAKLQDKLNEVNQYVIDNKFQPITSAYLVQTKQENKPIIEIYVGLNPNIL